MFSITTHHNGNIRLITEHDSINCKLKSLKFADFLFTVGTPFNEIKHNVFKSLCSFLAVCIFCTVNGDFEYGQFSFLINRKLTEYFTV